MFKKFEEKESISGVTQLKSSVQKGIRNKILETYPSLEPYMENFLPKKDQFKVVKCHDHIELLVNSSGTLLFFRHHNEQWSGGVRAIAGMCNPFCTYKRTNEPNQT